MHDLEPQDDQQLPPAPPGGGRSSLTPPADGDRGDRLFHEINLLMIEGRYFSFAPVQRGKRAKVGSERVQPLPDIKELKRQLKAEGKKDKSLFIVTPHPDRGQPGELAYKVLQVIIKRISELRFTSLDSVQFSFRELAHLCGRTAFGGKDVKELARAIDQLLTTVVTAGFYDRETKMWGVHQFTVVNSVAYRGDDKHNPTNPEGAVMLHPLFLKSLKDGYFLCLNFSRFGLLSEAITQALYKRLYFHFSNLFQKHTRDTFPLFHKKYEDICDEWLSGLKPRSHRSLILQQLGRHLDQLIRVGLLSSYDFVKRKDGSGFNLECLPGDGFFEDYKRFYTPEIPPGLQLKLIPPAPAPALSNLPEAALAVFFYEKKYGALPGTAGGSITQGDLTFASELLALYQTPECRSFVEFALSAANSTNFDVRSFAGLKQYLVAYRAKRDERARNRAADEERRKQEAAGRFEAQLQAEYDAFRTEQIDRIRATLPSSALAELGEQIEAKLKRDGYTFMEARGRMVRLVVNDQLAREHAVPSFEEWKAARTSGLT